jgi:hypothetical protein
MRRSDRWVRWLGAWLYGAWKGMPGSFAAWRQLDDATEEAADQAAIGLLGADAALNSARRKFLAAQPSSADALTRAVTPWTPSRRLAVAALGLVAVLPAVPLVVVPLCSAVCAAG